MDRTERGREADTIDDEPSRSEAKCPYCGEHIIPKIEPSATPEGSGEGVAGGTWVCPECGTILGVSEVDLV